MQRGKKRIAGDRPDKNIKELSEEKQKIKEDLDETKSAEEYKMRKQLQQENKIQGSYQYKNSGQYINVKMIFLTLVWKCQNLNK